MPTSTGTQPDAQKNLNKAQLEAVLKIDGPMLIVAGAGTGKTHVITERILHLLLKKNINPSQILALTFTEKAAQEMSGRVDDGLPFSYEEIAIKTFHGFCDGILRERGLEIGIDPGYKLLDQTQQWFFMKKNLFAFEFDYYRPLGNPNKFLFGLLNHFSRLKDEDISPESYQQYAEKLAKNAQDKATINDYETAHDSAPHKNKKQETNAQSTKEKAAKTLEIAKAYATWQHLMMEQNRLDFGDLQYYVLRLFERRLSVLQEYQERYRYILVDELQDTNFAQNKLITLLAKEHRNLTVVGDDDQAIYKWRGASLSNILNFKKTFGRAHQVVLTTNYRSAQPILDLAYAVIQNNNPYRLETAEKIDKRLVANNRTGKNGEQIMLSDSAHVVIRHFSSYLEEAQEIAATIQKLVTERNYSYKDFAILTRANNIAKPFVEALKLAQISFNVRARETLTAFEEIKDLLAVLRFLRNPYDDVAFFRLLSLPIFGLPMRSILDVAARAKMAGHVPIFKFLITLPKKNELQSHLPGINLAGEEIADFDHVYNFLDQLLSFTRQQAVSRIIGEFLDKSGYFKKLTEEDTLSNAEAIEHIAQFLEIATKFENDEGEKSLAAFLEYLEMLETAAITIEPIITEEHDTVSVLSVHSAKGLEFPVVFMPGLVNQRFPATNRGDLLEIPRELVKEELPEKDMHLQEERRLFYVGCTRAKNLLFLSYSDFYEGRKKWKVSRFLVEAEAAVNAAAEKVDAAEMPQRDEKIKTAALKPADGLGKTPEERAKKEGFKNGREPRSSAIFAHSTKEKLSFVPEINITNLSYSQLDTFKTCPFKYKFRYLFKVPSPSAHAANFGSSVHNTLNEFYQLLKNGLQASPELLHQCYEKNWIAAGYESRAHENARKKQGLELLQRFYEKESQPCFIIPVWLERKFRLKIGQFTFTGRIDRIDRLEDGSYEIIDYKTGTSKRDEDIKKDLQLALYGLVCRQIFKLNVSALSLYFLEDATKISTMPTPVELEEVKNELTRIAEDLQQSDFMPTPGYWCKFCEYRVLCYAAQ